MQKKDFSRYNSNTLFNGNAALKLDVTPVRDDEFTVAPVKKPVKNYKPIAFQLDILSSVMIVFTIAVICLMCFKCLSVTSSNNNIQEDIYTVKRELKALKNDNNLRTRFINEESDMNQITVVMSNFGYSIVNNNDSEEIESSINVKQYANASGR
ncbi:MAG: hypothetical protein MJ113_07825 [Lachnospiraceae bacterium]|nr:hypothetical protein [Lachnospiraceae bacterium]